MPATTAPCTATRPRGSLRSPVLRSAEEAWLEALLQATVADALGDQPPVPPSTGTGPGGVGRSARPARRRRLVPVEAMGRLFRVRRGAGAAHRAVTPGA